MPLVASRGRVYNGQESTLQGGVAFAMLEEPTHELLGVEVKEVSGELGTRKQGSWTGFVV